MIKRLIQINLLLSLFFTGSSQITRFEYGFQGGLNINSASGKGVSKDHKGTLTGLSVGGHFKWNNSEHFGIRAILSYDENGYAYRSLTVENSAGTGLVNADMLTQLNYLNLPVLAEYSFGNKVRINLDAGLFFGILLNSKLTTEFKDPLPPGQPAAVTSSSNNRHSFNYGLSIGFGLQVPVASKLNFDFDVRNHTGLSNINKSTGSGVIETNCFAILAGLSFGL